MSWAALLVALVAQLGDSSATSDPVSATRASLQAAKAEAASRPRAALFPRESYLRRTEIVDVRLSPDGRSLSFIRRSERGLDVMLQDVSSGAQSRIVAGLQRAETAWSGDGRRLWLADEQGLAVIESADLSPKRILKWDRRRSQGFWGVDARAPQYALIHERVAESGTRLYRYLSVDAQGQTRLLLEAEWPLRSALLDADGDLAFTAAFDGPRYETVIRQYTAEGPRELLRCDSREEGRLVGYDQAQRTLWLLSRHDEDKLSLRSWQEESGRWETRHRDPAGVSDANALLWSAAREDWLAIAYHDARRRWYGNDGGTRALLAALERQLPGANLQLSVMADDQLWLVQAQQADRAQDRHFLYRPEQDRLQPLFAGEGAAPGGPPAGAAMHPVCWRASDGMLLHGYVLLPSGMDPGTAPLIAWLHGGPIMRMYDEYNGGLQLLVNRGYAVFVPNFRVSTGYGLDYVLAADGDVGNGRVLADIIDGLDFLLAEGIGDRQRQAVMGMSFGGYASLLALSHHPARFRCAFAGAPPTEYGWLKQWQAEHDSEALRPEGPPLPLRFPLLGFPYEDAAWREKMQRESPLAALPALQAPAYIWAGARDDRVPLKSVVHYVGEARRLDKPLCLLIDTDAGHSPESELGTEASLYLIELAAHRHLGGELSPVSPELREFLLKNVRIDIDARR
ncbi:MAG TPA: prolyl oligopeptidase family serine peptidase [Planctomycetota bacterium]|nr:prolyl oligopeptidase family serine peptidase [Planctomycetota bacterium]